MREVAFYKYLQATYFRHEETCDGRGKLLRSCLKEYANIVLMGDLNVNMLAGNTVLTNLLEIYSFKNVVNVQTCYKSEK